MSRGRSSGWGKRGVLAALLAPALLTLAAAGCASKGKPMVSAATRDQATRYNLARVYLEQGKVNESIQQLNDLLREDPKHVEGHNLLGLAHWSVGRREEARAEFERALEINPYFSDARVNLGVVHSEEGRFAEADQEFQKALEDKTYPTPEKPLVNLAVNRIKQGQPARALEEAERAIRRNLNYTRAYDVFVQAVRGAEKAGAGPEYRALLRDMDRSLDFHVNIAEAFLKENEVRRARAHLQRVVALDPDGERGSRARQTLEKLP